MICPKCGKEFSSAKVFKIHVRQCNVVEVIKKRLDTIDKFDGPFELKIENNFDGLTKKEIVEELKAQGIEVPKNWKRVKKDDLIDLFGGE